MIFNLNKKIISSIILTLFFFSFLFLVPLADAYVKVFFKTDSQDIYKGDSFTVDLKISASDKPINVADGTILYDKEKIEIKEVRTEESIFSQWLKPPVFLNNKGQISFTGGIPGGFKGEDGQILEIVFLAKKNGKAQIDFQDIFSVFLNDGLGTGINPYLEPVLVSVSGKPIKVILQDSWQNLAVKNEGNNYVKIIVLSLLIIVIFVILYVRSKKNKLKNNQSDFTNFK